MYLFGLLVYLDVASCESPNKKAGIWPALVKLQMRLFAVLRFTYFVANDSPGGCTAQGAQSAAEDRVAQ